MQEGCRHSVTVDTTATDADEGRLTVSVTASRNLVNAVVSSTRTIALSAVANANGTATSTVQTRDKLSTITRMPYLLLS